jgi:hypothetical protein
MHSSFATVSSGESPMPATKHTDVNISLIPSARNFYEVRLWASYWFRHCIGVDINGMLRHVHDAHKVAQKEH